MCLYERTKFSACGHFTWSAVQEICAYWYKMMDKEQNCIKLCPFKRVRKINHAEIGLRCPPCTRPQIFAPPSQYEALKTGWLPEGLICIIGPRVTIKACEDLNCLLLTGHALPHHYSADCDLLLCKFLFHIDSLEQDVRWWQVATSREVMDRLAENSKEIALRMHMLNLLVLEAMEILTSQTDRVRGQEWSVTASPQPVQGLPEALLKKMDDSAQAMPMKLPMRLRPAVAWRSKRRLLNTGTTSPGSECPYSELDFSCNQIRLFELHPLVSSSNISGSFHCVDISTAPEYTALSYTWGKGSASSTIEVHGHGAIDVRENLFEFLQQQARGASQPKLFWIDAICINQSNVHERNHQVNLMKRIYAEAKQVYVWLGKEANNSDLAMDYVSLKGKGPLVERGPGYARLWSKKEGRALVELFERPYWRRMWIIQEIIHAGRLTVCCGNKWFEWDALESLFLKLKKLKIRAG